MAAPPLRLICDEMLAGLARWLRAAGHDTALLPPGTPDAEVLRVARVEGRTLLTRDARMAAEGSGAIRLSSDDLNELAAELVRRLDLDWTAAPFTRCLVDNTPLRAASAAERQATPPASRDLPGPFLACPVCARVYWPGSHVRRMRSRLEQWRTRP